MGAVCSCCVKQSETANYPVGDVTMMPLFPNIDIVFTKDQASKIQQADCVITNASLRHPQNQYYFKHLDKKDLQSIKELMQQGVAGGAEVISNPTSTLKIKDIINMNLPVWGQPEDEQNLRKALSGAFKQAIKRNYKTIIVTQFQQQRGIPTNVICRVIMNVLSQNQKQLAKIIFNIEDNSKREYFAKQLHGTTQPIKRVSSLSSSLSK